MKLVFTILVLTFIYCNASTQSLIDLYEKLKIEKGWKKSLVNKESYSIDSTYYKGTIVLEKKKRRVEIEIYNVIVLKDSVFENKREERAFRSSCRNYSGSVPRMSSFTTKEFYIYPKLCPSCNFRTDKKCKIIPKSYLIWSYLVKEGIEIKKIIISPSGTWNAIIKKK